VIHLSPTRLGRNNYVNHITLTQNLRPMAQLWQHLEELYPLSF
jgi:hypothetical protein